MSGAIKDAQVPLLSSGAQAPTSPEPSKAAGKLAPAPGDFVGGRGGDRGGLLSLPGLSSTGGGHGIGSSPVVSSPAGISEAGSPVFASSSHFESNTHPQHHHHLHVELRPCERLLIFILFTQVVQGLMSYDGGATQFCTSALARSGWSPLWLGMLGAMDKFGQVATAFVWGSVLMRWETKPLLVVGLFWKAACCAVFGYLQSQPVSVVMQLLMLSAKLGMGVTEALISVWATVWVQRNAPADARARWQGFAGTSAGIGSGVGSGVASLWDPIGAFYLQAAVLFGIWAFLLFTPSRMFRFSAASPAAGVGMQDEDDFADGPTFPRQMLVEQVVRGVSHKAHEHETLVIVESLRLPAHFLDASVDPLDHGFKVRITKGDPMDGDWAQFKMCRWGDQYASFESVRLPGHFLDASGEQLSFRDKRVKVRLSEWAEDASPASFAWAQFRLHQGHQNSGSGGQEDERGIFHIESVRLPRYFLAATGEKMLRGTRICLVQANPEEGQWSGFRIKEVDPCGLKEPVPVSFSNEASLIAQLCVLLGNHLWLWTALAISLNCFVTSGISFLWQNTIENVWGFDNGWSYFLFLFSTGISGLVGVVVGPQIFDRKLGGFALPQGKAICLLWCKRMTFAAAICGTLCTVLLVVKAANLVYSNEESVVYWELVVLVLCIFGIFFCINSITGALYGINTESVGEEARTFAAGLTVSFQNVFGYAFGPLLPSAASQLVGSSVREWWPHWPWDPMAVDGAKFAAGMSFALINTWALFCFARMAAVSARLATISMRAKRNRAGDSPSASPVRFSTAAAASFAMEKAHDRFRQNS